MTLLIKATDTNIKLFLETVTSFHPSSPRLPGLRGLMLLATGAPTTVVFPAAVAALEELIPIDKDELEVGGANEEETAAEKLAEVEGWQLETICPWKQTFVETLINQVADWSAK